MTVTTKMYRMKNELGDCFLLTFKDNDQTCNLLIDCGSFRNSDDAKTHLKEIAAHIKEDIGDMPIDVVIATHQHNDHVSGFFHAQDIFKQIGINNLWLSWMDSPMDAEAKEIQENGFKLTRTLTDIHNLLERKQGLSKNLAALKDNIGSTLGFNSIEFVGANGEGKKPEIPAKAYEF